MVKSKDGDNEKINGVNLDINDLRFKGRRSVDWNIVEDCLKEYIGECVEITETSDVVYIGTDFPDEFSHSKDTKALRGANMYAKANSSSIIREMIEIAANKTFAENYAQKHNTDAKILVRHAMDGKLYLYDILRTKKKRASRLSNSCTVEKLISLCFYINDI